MKETFDMVFEFGKFAVTLLPAVWFLSEKIKGISGKIDVLETRLEGKIDSKVALLDQKIDAKISLIELQIKQYAESVENNKKHVESIESKLEQALKRLDLLEARR